MNNELKPCPFCGDPKILIYTHGLPGCDGGNGEFYFFRCDRCSIEIFTRHEIKSKAIESWNKRE